MTDVFFNNQDGVTTIAKRATDPVQPRPVYREVYEGFLITGSINRHGGFTVLVGNDFGDVVWQGDNILAARLFVSETLSYVPEIRGKNGNSFDVV